MAVGPCGLRGLMGTINPFPMALCVSLLLATDGAEAKAPGRLNDTGQDLCIVDGLQTTVCAGTGQDAEFGRDATFPSNQNGANGFSFVKISSSGAELPASATEWACVKDQVTGLTWEVKTDDGGLHDKDNSYTANHWDRGQPGDVIRFVSEVNAAGLCGQSDWRLPTRMELIGLVDFGKRGNVPAIDAAWFPNATFGNYRTGTRFFKGKGHWTVNFGDGTVSPEKKFLALPTRLVLAPPGGQWSAMAAAQSAVGARQRYVAEGDEVLDTTTGLVWRRCSEGQDWTGDTCARRATEFSWTGALDHAQAVADGGAPWRLPNAKELASLVDDTIVKPAIDRKVFPRTSSGCHWSSTHLTRDADFEWTVDFERGFLSAQGRPGKCVIRLVRPGS